jgi:cell wall-associated NlpC family hydrolase
MHSQLVAVGRSTRRRLLTGVAVASAIIGCGLGPNVADAAPAPTVDAGDPYSPTVVALATHALSARDVYAIDASPESFHRYQDRLAATAVAVAIEFSADPAVVEEAWRRAGLPNQTAVLAALTQLGNDYQYASSDPAVGFDCSGLTSFAWRRAGVELPPQSGSQIDVSPRIDGAQAVAGDLVQYPGHVMLYLGFSDAMVHAANEATNVELSVLPERGLNWADPNG